MSTPDSSRQAPKTLGVYVHFPWCLEKCPYCDFLSVAAPRDEIPHRAYADAVCREIDQRHETLSSRRAHSIFIGGGTPSLWHPDELGRVLRHLRRHLDVPNDVEITVECNPSSFSAEFGRRLRGYGVNRVSIGVQGLEDDRLRFLGRLHDGRGALTAVKAAITSSIPEVSADLIYGVYRQEPERAASEVAQIADLGVTHLSAYALTIEPGTVFGARARKGKLPLLDDDLVAASFDAVRETLASKGFEHYEISNFGRGPRRSRHNLGYWRGEPYLGLGCGAWGTLPFNGEVIRYRNPISPERYLERRTWPVPAPNNPGNVYPHVEPLDAPTRLQERLLLGLRLAEGVDVQATEQELNTPFLTDERRRAAERLRARGHLEMGDERWRIPSNAWLFADHVIRELL